MKGRSTTCKSVSRGARLPRNVKAAGNADVAATSGACGARDWCSPQPRELCAMRALCRRITKVESIVETTSGTITGGATHTPSLAAVAEAKALAHSVESEVRQRRAEVCYSRCARHWGADRLCRTHCATAHQSKRQRKPSGAVIEAEDDEAVRCRRAHLPNNPHRVRGLWELTCAAVVTRPDHR